MFTNQMCAIKVKSKLEMYWLLSADGKVYLPLIKQENYNYMIVILQEKALKQKHYWYKLVLLDNLKLIIVSKICKLNIQKMIKFSTKHVDSSSYLLE